MSRRDLEESFRGFLDSGEKPSLPVYLAPYNEQAGPRLRAMLARPTIGTRIRAVLAPVEPATWASLGFVVLAAFALLLVELDTPWRLGQVVGSLIH